MRLLLDTQVYLWTVTDSRKLNARARQTIVEASEVYVSAASIWEIAIKASLGKLEGDPRELADAVAASGFRELPVNSRHAAMVHGLPFHHHDPFDRLLLAQALCEPLRFLTADQTLAQYSELVMTI